MTDDKHKVQPYSVRLPAELRSRLEAAAAAAGRTLHQEVIFRLGSSFGAAPIGRFAACDPDDDNAEVTVGDLSTKELFDQMAAPDGVLDRLAEKLKGYIRLEYGRRTLIDSDRRESSPGQTSNDEGLNQK